jgi:heterodisulfide reductase subunit C2
MTIRIKKGQSPNGILDAVVRVSGVDLSGCYQCKKCSSGCTVGGHTASPPSEMIRRLQLGAGDELLNSDIIWACSSCETCFVRCPMEIDFASVMDALRTLAIERKAAPPKGDMPLFNRAFLKTVQLFGRTYDLAMIAAYKIRSSTYGSDLDKVPAMIKKRKIAFLPPRGADKKTVRKIFGTIGITKGNQK